GARPLKRAFTIAAIALAGAAVSMQLSGGMSIVQHTVSNSMRGRIMGVYSTCMIGFAPFAAMLAGTLGSSVGVTATLSLCAAVVAGSALLYLLYLFYVRLTRPGKVRNDRS
ncbi:MAG TPA: MFS transporter, partial [Candidatus Melainabacteria bacterium]|nr:MFS transporter [Candidatus Melainabacteria bacterium]